LEVDLSINIFEVHYQAYFCGDEATPDHFQIFSSVCQVMAHSLSRLVHKPPVDVNLDRLEAKTVLSEPEGEVWVWSFLINVENVEILSSVQWNKVSKIINFRLEDLGELRIQVENQISHVDDHYITPSPLIKLRDRICELGSFI
jgi:hypothetical protein